MHLCIHMYVRVKRLRHVHVIVHSHEFSSTLICNLYKLRENLAHLEKLVALINEEDDKQTKY